MAIANAIKLPVPSPIEVRPVSDDDVETVVLDPAKTHAAFVWRHKVGFEEMIMRMVRWYDEFGVSAIHTHLKNPAIAGRSV